jgi:hypothetical protein
MKLIYSTLLATVSFSILFSCEGAPKTGKVGDLLDKIRTAAEQNDFAVEKSSRELAENIEEENTKTENRIKRQIFGGGQIGGGGQVGGGFEGGFNFGFQFEVSKTGTIGLTFSKTKKKGSKGSKGSSSSSGGSSSGGSSGSSKKKKCCKKKSCGCGCGCSCGCCGK